VAETLAGLYACTEEPDDRLPEATTERLTQVAADISDYLSTGTPAGTLSGMATQDIKRWLVQYQEQLHTCTLTPGQLPGAPTR
jgi:hypothetical protein